MLRCSFAVQNLGKSDRWSYYSLTCPLTKRSNCCSKPRRRTRSMNCTLLEDTYTILYLPHKQGWWHLTTWWHWVWCLSCSEVGKPVLVCTMFLQDLKSCFKLTMLKVLVPRTKRKRHAYTACFFAQVWDQAEDFLLAFISVSLLKWNWMNLVYLCLSHYLAMIFIVLYGLPTGSNWASPVWQVPQFELRLRAWHFQNTFEERWET